MRHPSIVPGAPPAPRAAEPRFDLAGETLVPLAQRALWWPREATLLVADVHIGKAAAFRALGVPVPAGTTAGTLARLDSIIAAHRARRLVVLGDFLHSRHALEPATRAALVAWRAASPAREIVLVRGNHDAHAGDPPAELAIDIVEEPLELGPFALRHEPQPHASRYVLSGHLHPAVRIAGRADSLRLPCFWFGPRTGVLPAFGEFTGSLTVRPAADDRVFAIAGDAVVDCSPSARGPIR